MEIDESAQNHPVWLQWSRPQQISESIDRMFTETLPGVPADWRTHSGKSVGPMPQVDRYSDELTLFWLKEVFGYFFPDDDALTEPGNARVANEFACYVGNYFVQHCAGRWTNDPDVGGLILPSGPVITYEWTAAVDDPVDLLFTAAEQDGFSWVTQAWYSRSVDYAKVHGLPHKFFQVEQELGLT
ncbi:hypothetical protein [Nocardia flavorosea]|uniref:Uncharacterized protein n=1 Tax=Nocardia flavorosea TaxID=53429 RepID=A0A846YJR1_9NOCA|nr:hypothetical protein [Nocardia flavorosea]NKY59155.1 hypothetical protein [Nocardia flavorosea]